MDQQPIKTTCVTCKEDLFIPTPIIRIVNQPEFSMIVLSHEQPVVCPECQSLYAVTIKGLDAENKVVTGLAMLKPSPTAPVAVPESQAQIAIRPGGQ